MQGGIGKTVISSWLVRQSHVRQTFEKIVWITLGQTPNLGNLQGLLYEQLVASGTWSSDWTDEVKTQRLGEAFHGQNVLLVLDDLCEYLARPALLCTFSNAVDCRQVRPSTKRH